MGVLRWKPDMMFRVFDCHLGHSVHCALWTPASLADENLERAFSFAYNMARWKPDSFCNPICSPL